MNNRIIPAYAGPTTSSVRLCPQSQDHPRIRGAYQKADHRTVLKRGSSPHTRGLQAVLNYGNSLTGIIPAYAGPT